MSNERNQQIETINQHGEGVEAFAQEFLKGLDKNVHVDATFNTRQLTYSDESLKRDIEQLGAPAGQSLEGRNPRSLPDRLQSDFNNIFKK